MAFDTSRTIAATPEQVFAAFTDGARLARWWGPAGFTNTFRDFGLEAREGGVLQYDMVADSPEMIAEMKRMGAPVSHPTRSTFVVVKPRTKLVLRNVINFLPGVETYESDITEELSADGDHVRMVVTLDPMHNEQFSQMQKEGFGSQLGKLDARWR